MHLPLSSLAYGLLLVQVPASWARQSGPDPDKTSLTTVLATSTTSGAVLSTSSSIPVDALTKRKVAARSPKAITRSSLLATCTVTKTEKWTTIYGNVGPELAQCYVNPNTGSFAGSYGLYSKPAHNSASVTFQIGAKSARFGIIHSGKTYYLGIKPQAKQGYYAASFWSASQMAKQKLSYALCVQCTSGHPQCFTESTGHQIYMLFSGTSGVIWTTEKINLTDLPGTGYGLMIASNPVK